MSFEPSRLRRAELIVGAGAVVLLVDLFGLSWYGLSGTLAPTAARLGSSTAVNGWNGLTHIRWLVLLTLLVALALVYFQAAERAPAIPVSLGVVLSVLAVLTELALIYRVLLNVPGADGLIVRKAGAWIGLAAGLVLFYGAYASLRTEELRPEDGPGEIETVSLGRSA